MQSSIRVRWRAYAIVLIMVVAAAQTPFEVVRAQVPMNILEADIEHLQQAQSAGELSALELVEFYLRRIERYDQTGPELNAIAHLNRAAREQAIALDEERAKSGPRSVLHGIPVLVKDNYETIGMPTTAGSALFEGFAPQRDASLVQRLKQAGAIILGKTTMHEFAYGITTQGSAFGSTRNPYDLQRNPGGSSGGTGAAVAANFAAIGMGSDTCGSIRIPSAHNNLVGLRGTQGLSSRAGIVPLSHTQDIGGPLARSVRDLAIVLGATVGFDEQDPQSADSLGKTADYITALKTRTGVRVGLLSDLMVQAEPDQAVADVVSQALAALTRRANWTLKQLPSPLVNASVERPLNGHFVLIHDFKTSIETYLQDNPSLGYENLAAMIAAAKHDPSIHGSLALSATMTDESNEVYLMELDQRRHVRHAILKLMAEHDVDVLAYPTIRQLPAAIGEEQYGTNCKLSANSGLPSISVPAGFIDGVPVGLEMLAEPWSEQKLLDLAYTVEEHLPLRRLPVNTP